MPGTGWQAGGRGRLPRPRSNVRYAYDIEIPYISTWILSEGGETYVADIWTYTSRNYVQTPKLTVDLGQGDCDDQAILAYAMLKYYMRNVHGKYYSLYLAYIEFSDNNAHLAVFMPVSGGNICIIDPASAYLTKNIFGTITSKEALSELNAYSSSWRSSAGSITYIRLYSVAADGSYMAVSEESMSQVAQAFR